MSCYDSNDQNNSLTRLNVILLHAGARTHADVFARKRTRKRNGQRTVLQTVELIAGERGNKLVIDRPHSLVIRAKSQSSPESV